MSGSSRRRTAILRSRCGKEVFARTSFIGSTGSPSTCPPYPKQRQPSAGKLFNQEIRNQARQADRECTAVVDPRPAILSVAREYSGTRKYHRAGCDPDARRPTRNAELAVSADIHAERG